jgi:hypothetical protein
VDERGVVNAAVVRGPFMLLFGEACLLSGTCCLWQSGRRVHEETSGVSSGAWQRIDAAPVGNKVMKLSGDRQESAKAIVIKSRRETCGHGEGPNSNHKEES